MGLASAALGVVGEARAETVSMRVVAPCSTAEDLAARMAQRTSVTLAPARVGLRALEFEVEATSAQRYRGSFWVRDERGTSSTRRHEEGSSCEEVIDALSLSASLAMGEAVDTPAPSRMRWTYAMGAALSVEGYAAPGALPGAKLYLRARPNNGAMTVLAGLGWTGFGLTRAAPASATFQWWKAHASFCPMQVKLYSPLSLAPCATAQLGLIQAQATGALNSKNDTSLWLEAGAQARFALKLSSGIELDASGGISAPMIRPDFVVAPTLQLYRAPALALAAELGASVAF